MPSSEIDGAITAATEKALEVSGSYFKDLMTFHLKNKCGTGLETVALEPEKFHKAISSVIGEYSTRILENLILQMLLTGISPPTFDGQVFPQTIRKIQKGELKISQPITST